MKNRPIYITVEAHIEANSLTREQANALTAEDMSLDAEQTQEWRAWKSSILKRLSKYFDRQEDLADADFIKRRLDGGTHNRKATRERFGVNKIETEFRKSVDIMGARLIWS